MHIGKYQTQMLAFSIRKYFIRWKDIAEEYKANLAKPTPSPVKQDKSEDSIVDEGEKKASKKRGGEKTFDSVAPSD